MAQMSEAQRAAVLDAHCARRLLGSPDPYWSRGYVITGYRTMAVLLREGWVAEGAFLRSSPVTTAGLIAAGVDMDTIHAEARIEAGRRRVAAARQGRAEALDGTLGGAEMVLAVLPFVIEQAHAEALTEDRAITHAIRRAIRCADPDAYQRMLRERSVAIERDHAEALTEDDARSVAEGRKLLGWDETPAERDRRMTAEFIEAMNAEYARTGVAGALADVAAVWRTINAPEGFRPVDVRPLLDRIEAALQNGA